MESNYIKRFLEVMRILPGKLDSDSQIVKLLYFLKIDALIPFHQNLLENLKVNAQNTKEGRSPNIADVFIKFKVSPTY